MEDSNKVLSNFKAEIIKKYTDFISKFIEKYGEETASSHRRCKRAEEMIAKIEKLDLNNVNIELEGSWCISIEIYGDPPYEENAIFMFSVNNIIPDINFDPESLPPKVGEIEKLSLNKKTDLNIYYYTNTEAEKIRSTPIDQFKLERLGYFMKLKNNDLY